LTDSDKKSRRVTREQWLESCAEHERNGTGEPAHTEATRYAPVPAKLQAVAAALNKPIIRDGLRNAHQAQRVADKPIVKEALRTAQKVECQLRAELVRARRRVAVNPRNAALVASRRRGHAPRPGTNARTKGPRRTTTASRSRGDPDEPGESDSEAPDAAPVRRCANPNCNPGQLPEDISDLRADAKVCRKAKCRRAWGRRHPCEAPWCEIVVVGQRKSCDDPGCERQRKAPKLPPRRHGNTGRLWRELRPVEWPPVFVGAVEYVANYGSGPVNPFVADHLDHDHDAEGVRELEEDETAAESINLSEELEEAA
jgi:hypothetical protein